LSDKADLDRKYHHRVLKFLVIYIALIGLSLLIGILGYRLTENYAWIDCLLNTAMLMGGMGQINPLQSDAGKAFASAFSIYCGTFEILGLAVVLSPVARWFLQAAKISKPQEEQAEEKEVKGEKPKTNTRKKRGAKEEKK
jgi:Na+/glutamate symporter